jgi:putative flippase GtrA
MKKLAIDFTKYSVVGFLITLANVFFMWLFIDVLKIYTLIASSIVVVSLFFVKFMAYYKVNLIHKQFFKYTAIQTGSGLLNIIGVWLLIDMLNVPTVPSSLFVVCVLFVLRFVFFKMAKLTVR